MCQTNLSLAHASPLGFNPISVLLQFPGYQHDDNDPVWSDLENEERRARWRINSANVAPRRILVHSSNRRAELRLRTLEPPYDARSWPLASPDQRGRAKQSWKRIRATNRHVQAGRMTSRSIRPTKFNKLSGARAAAHKSAGMRPALIGRRNPVLLFRHAAEKTGKMRTPR